MPARGRNERAGGRGETKKGKMLDLDFKMEVSEIETRLATLPHPQSNQLKILEQHFKRSRKHFDSCVERELERPAKVTSVVSEIAK